MPGTRDLPPGLRALASLASSPRVRPASPGARQHWSTSRIAEGSSLGHHVRVIIPDPQRGGEEPVPADPTLAPMVSAMIAEYAALREEIRAAAEHQRTMVQIAITVLGGVLGLIGIADKAGSDVQRSIGLVLLLTPLIPVLILLTVADASRRIVLMASYLHRSLGSRLQRRLDSEPVWQWETFVHDANGRLQGLAKGRTRLGDKGRWVILALPGLVAVIAYYVLPQPEHRSTAAIVLSIADIVLLLGALAALVLTEGPPVVDDAAGSVAEMPIRR